MGGTLIGHERLRDDLRRLADRRILSHGYLFWGPERVGKKTVALSLANYLENSFFSPPYDPRGEIKIPLVDCLLVAPTKEKTIGIDDVREIKNFLHRSPLRSSYRTVVIDDGHSLTDQAQNALLKIAENPPLSTLIIVVAKDPEMLRPTLASRLQKLYFPLVPRDTIREWLQKDHHLSSSEAEKLITRSFREPGRAWAMLYEKNFEIHKKFAETFLSSAHARRRSFIREMVEDENFNLEDFLDAVLVHIIVHREYGLWHRAMELRREASYFNLNPRLQLEYLAWNLT